MARRHPIQLAKKTRKNWMENKKVQILKFPSLMYVKNCTSYIITLCIFLKRISLRIHFKKLIKNRQTINYLYP